MAEKSQSDKPESSSEKGKSQATTKVDDKKDGLKDEDQVEAEQEVSDATDQVQDVADEEQKAGFRGTEVDMTPNENYTVAGVVEGKPVPEMEPDKTAAAFRATNPDLQRPH